MFPLKAISQSSFHQGPSPLLLSVCVLLLNEISKARGKTRQEKLFNSLSTYQRGLLSFSCDFRFLFQEHTMKITEAARCEVFQLA